MKILLLILLFSSSAFASSLEIVNNEVDKNNKLDVRAQAVLVGQRFVSINTTATVPSRNAGTWHDIFLCHNDIETDNNIRIATTPSVEIKLRNYTPSGKTCILVSTWGTETFNNGVQGTFIQTAKQIDRLIQFTSGINFHPDWSFTPPKTTSGMLRYIAPYSAFPAGRTAAVWIWAESQKYDENADLGIAQCNVFMGNNIQEETPGGEGWSMRNKGKFLARTSQIDWGKEIRIPTLEGNKDGLLAIQVSSHSRCLFYGYGYEMRIFFPIIYP